MYRSLSNRGSFTQYECVSRIPNHRPKVDFNQTPYFPVLDHPNRPNFRRGRRIPLQRAEGLTYMALCDFRPSRSQKGHERRTKARRSYQPTTYKWSSFRAH